MADEPVFIIWLRVSPIDIEIGAEPASVDQHAELVTKCGDRGIAEYRDRTAIIQAAVAEAQRHRLAAALFEICLQFGRFDGIYLSLWRGDIDIESFSRRKDRIDRH